MNPGPVAYVRLGFLNARSIVRKSAFIHNIILSNTLSILAIQETRISNLDPLNVIQDAAPDSFTVLHTPHPWSEGWGLAIAAHKSFTLNDLTAKINFVPQSFGLQVCSQRGVGIA